MKSKDDKVTPRNWVKKATNELGLKPARFRDRKHDYDRNDRRKEFASERKERDAASESDKRAIRLREDKNWCSDYEEEPVDFYWDEYAEDPSVAEEVQ